MPRPRRDHTATPQREAAREFLRAALSERPRTAGELQEHAAARGINVRTLRRAADDLGVVKSAERGAGGAWWWELPR